jgi:uncharacterized protein YjdB
MHNEYDGGDTMKRWLSVLLTITLLAGVSTLAPAFAADETAVSFATDAVYLAVGKYTTVKVSVTPYAAKKKGVTYAVSDEAVATVTSKGKVTAVAVGECQLTATSVYDPTVSASVPVKVIMPVSDLSVTAPSDAVFIGQSLLLNTAVKPADATEQSVRYASSSDAVATVNTDGLVTGIGRGKATITVTSVDGYAKATFALNVRQQPESVDVAPESVAAATGKKVQLKATVLPKDANDKTVAWASGDERIATVSAKGLVTLVGVGQTQVTATANDNPAASAAVPVQGMELAQSIAFDSTLYTVNVGETTQLFATVLPQSTTDKTVTWQVKDKRVATVDENGLVTALKGGKTTVYAHTADGSKKRASATVQVLVPVTGVSYRYKDVRVGAGGYGTFTADITPKNATDKAMTWVSSDEGIATVSGTTNRFKVKGRRWGRCKVTGTTEDGGFTVEVYVDVGSLRHAVTVTSLSIKNGKPYLTLRNQSDMDISQVRIELLGYDDALQPIVMSLTVDDPYTLTGSYNMPLAPGEKTTHGQFTFYKHSDYVNLAVLQVTITGWSTDTGYYDRNGRLQYNYNIAQDKWEWVTYPSNVNPTPR